MASAQMRLAALADIHGNLSALRAVLADLDSQGGADGLLVLGDIVLLGPDPAGVVEELMERGAIGIYGNTDRFLLDRNWSALEPESEDQRADQALCQWALERLDEKARGWLQSLPFQRDLTVGAQRVLLVHGSPRSVGDVIQTETPDADVREMITGARADLILFGHTHTPLDRTVDDVRLINPGAVGYPQGEASTARYALLTWNGSGWHVDFRLVRYDVGEVIRRLLEAERPYRLWIAETLRSAGRVPLETFE
jgi:putative phosphoesterase